MQTVSLMLHTKHSNSRIFKGFCMEHHDGEVRPPQAPSSAQARTFATKPPIN